MIDNNIFFMCWFYSKLVSGKLIALVRHYGSDVLLDTLALAVEEEVVGAAIVRQREDQ